MASGLEFFTQTTQMAAAGLLQLIYSGFQEDRLLPPKGQPHVNVFTKTFMKTGRCTTEWYAVQFDGNPSLGKTVKATLPRRGHLITKAFLVTVLPDISTPQKNARTEATALGSTVAGPLFGWTNSIGHALINEAEVTIGASPIDTLDGRLMEVMDEFNTPLEKVTTVNRMLGRHDNGFSYQSNGYSQPNQKVITPLPFWFTRNREMALPMDAIGSDTVQISITYSPLSSLYVAYKNIVGSSAPQLSQTNGVYTPIQSATFTTLSGTKINQNKASMPSILDIQSAYILLEYVYLDKPEANRIRLGDITYRIPQHYAISPHLTNGQSTARIQIRIPNLASNIFFMAHRTDADSYNAPFHAARELMKGSDIWWPDASGLRTLAFTQLIPAYSGKESEPIRSVALVYEGKFLRYGSDAPVYFRSIMPTFDKTKAPWHNKYYYNLPFSFNGQGHANLDKIQKVDLALEFKPMTGTMSITNLPAYTIYIWVETYGILRVYGGRAGLLFGY